MQYFLKHYKQIKRTDIQSSGSREICLATFCIALTQVVNCPTQPICFPEVIKLSLRSADILCLWNKRMKLSLSFGFYCRGRQGSVKVPVNHREAMSLDFSSTTASCSLSRTVQSCPVAHQLQRKILLSFRVVNSYMSPRGNIFHPKV